ncbi:MAG: 4'-phosphopantetheinyl transferase superfamily protein [Desulfuromonadales bacterium]|nr:4'-phosphopantetheinyl transferase superfamily protein [Desulfuromonadales bacterium]
MSSVQLTCWQPSPTRLDLDRQTAHLWRFRLDLSAAEIGTLTHLLSAEEQHRATRLRDPAKGAHFIVGRGRLRQILARYLDCPPTVIEFSSTAQGKPHLTACKGLSFNLAHAGEWGVLLVAAGSEVGVDIEQIDPRLDFEQVVARYFSAAEESAMQRCPAPRQRRFFFRLWTRKEAGLKYQGCGFSAPLSATDSKARSRLFTPARGYLGALTVVDRIAVVQRWDF